MRCVRCGSENSDGNRFCGMCGASLLPKAQAPVVVPPPPGRQPVAPEVGPPQAVRLPARLTSNVTDVAAPVANRPASVRVNTPASPTPDRVAEARVSPPSVNSSGYSSAHNVAPARDLPSYDPANDSSPMITGPSFLGLGDARGRSSSNSVDYLLEDDEEPKRGWGKALIVLIALALIGGFGYLRWKQGGFNFLKSAPAVQGDAAPQPGANSVTDQNTKPTGSDAAKDAANPSPSDTGAAGPSAAGAGSASPATPATPDTSTSATGTNPAPRGTDAGAPLGTDANAGSSGTSPTGAAAPGNTERANTEEKPPAENSTATDSADDGAAPAKAAPVARSKVAKPSPARTRERKPSAAAATDPTTEAERYIYGRSIPQDCERGLRMLKPAADQADPKAMIALGTLYSSGTCTPRDLPTAYRWFARALHKQPDNQVLQSDLQKLWSQMTPPERQLAIKLSQ